MSDDDSQTPKKPSAVLRLLQRRSITRLARILTRMRIQSLAVMAVAGQKLSKWWQTLGSFFSLCWQHLAMPDRTMANVVSIVLTAVGVLVVFTKYSVPEVNMTFYGANPFTWKREIIENAMTWIFTAVTLLGLAIQGWAEIFELPTRSHTRHFYLFFTLSSIFMSVLLTIVLTAAGHTIAKRSWLPRVLVWYSGSYNWVDFMLTHNGMSADELIALGKIPKAQQSEYQRNWEQAGGPLNGFGRAERDVTLMEDLLDITPTPGLSLQLRFDRLKPYFQRRLPLNLREADLHDQELQGFDISGADLEKADLTGAVVTATNFAGANLHRAYLILANLSGANLRKADLSEADLRLAILSQADLSGTDLRGAHLEDANLRTARGLTQQQIDHALGNLRTQLPNSTCPIIGESWTKGAISSTHVHIPLGNQPRNT